MTRGMAPAPRPVTVPLPRLVRVLVVGPPLRVGPLQAARSPAALLSLTDDPAEGTRTDVRAAGADVCLLDPGADELAPYFRGTGAP